MATVIKLVNELIAKEDVSWGNSSSTFTRETYTGGSISVHYIDAEIIPSTTLGGYIGDNLHVKNTDTGTTSSTFALDSDGTGVTLSTSGITGGRTLTFPDGSNQALVGATDLLSTAANKGATTVGIRDVGNYFAGTNVETVLQEAGSDISTLQSSTHNSGMKNGFILNYSSTVAITIAGGIWAHNGTTDQHLYTASQITFTLGPSGSNTSSSNLGASQIHYIYIHNASVISRASRLLTASEFLNSTTAPTWSHSKVGWYNSSDRCIGAVLTNGSSQVLSFGMFSDNYYRYASPVEEFSVAAAGVTYTALDISSSVPTFSTRARIRLLAGTSNTSYYFDTSSTAVWPDAQTVEGYSTFDIALSSAQAVYWYANNTGNTTIHVCGYYIDGL